MSNELTKNLPSSQANTSIARWYAVQVASSCEKKVKATLEQRSVTLGVNTVSYTHLTLPTSDLV